MIREHWIQVSRMVWPLLSCRENVGAIAEYISNKQNLLDDTTELNLIKIMVDGPAGESDRDRIARRAREHWADMMGGIPQLSIKAPAGQRVLA